MSYLVPPTSISQSLRLVDLRGQEISQDNRQIFISFENHLIDTYKEGNLVFIYRGESFKGLQKKLFSNNEDFSKSRLYERLFILGDKARFFFSENMQETSNRGWLTNINDRSTETFNYIFKRIANVLSTPKLGPRIQMSCSSKFLNFFGDQGNCEEFISLVETSTRDNEEDRLKLRDYYLYFLHVAGSAGIRKETMLVSTSLSVEISKDFSGKIDKDKLVLYGFIPQPYHNYLVSPWLASEYHNIASGNGLPTYQPNGLFPEQLEVSVKGAFFSCFMISVKQIENEDFVVNPHIFSILDYENASKYGIPVQQENFMDSILASGYRRYMHSDFQGNFEQYDLHR